MMSGDADVGDRANIASGGGGYADLTSPTDSVIAGDFGALTADQQVPVLF